MCRFRISSWSMSSLATWLFSSAIMNSSSSSEKLSVNTKNTQFAFKFFDLKEMRRKEKKRFVWNFHLLITYAPFESGWRLWQCFIASKISSIRFSSCGVYQISVIRGSSSAQRKVEINNLFEIIWKLLLIKLAYTCTFVVIIILNITIFCHLFIITIVCMHLAIAL